jgi:thiopeptide-type bacteriocin biosynthesis protein
MRGECRKYFERDEEKDFKLRRQFAPGEVVLVRLPRFKLELCDSRPVHVWEEGGVFSVNYRKYIEQILEIDGFRIAILDATPSVDNAIKRFHNSSRPMSEQQVENLALTLTKYLLRASARATPFRLLAGVAVAELSRDGKRGVAEFGESHVCYVMPPVDSTFERQGSENRDEPESMTGEILTNGMLRRRAGKYAVYSRGGISTVRRTPVTEYLLESCARPKCIASEIRIASQLTGESEVDVGRVLEKLVTNGFMFYDVVDSKRYSLDIATPIAVPVQSYETLAKNGGPDQSVDLRMDATIRFPSVICDEVKNVAQLLSRVSGRSTDANGSSAFFNAFLNRYGPNVAVPLADLFDPVQGLGGRFNEILENASSHDIAAKTDQGHDAFLIELAQSCLVDGMSSVDLNEETIQVLENLQPPAPLPESFELRFHLFGRSMESIDQGEFVLLQAGPGGDAPALSGFGRHLFMFPERATEFRRELHRERIVTAALRLGEAGATPNPSEVALSKITDAEIVIDRMPVSRISLYLDELLIVAKDQRFVLFRSSDGSEVNPIALSLCDIAADIEIVKFLRLLRRQGTVTPFWRWAAANRLPWLPRVSFGRTVLAPSRWLVPNSLKETRLPWDEWLNELYSWRAKWQVPIKVKLLQGSDYLPLDLTNTIQLKLLRSQLARGEEVALVEDLIGITPNAVGWSKGRLAELIIPIKGVEQRNATTVEASEYVGLGTKPRQRFPMDEWLYLKLYCPQEQQNQILRDHIPALLAIVAGGFTEWHFVRYADPSHHLRIRFRVNEFRYEVLNSVCKWASNICESSAASKYAIETYELEAERYGGGALLDLVHRIFWHDSNLVVSRMKDGRLANHSLSVLSGSSNASMICGLGRESRLIKSIAVSLPKGERVNRNESDAAWELSFPKEEFSWFGIQHDRNAAFKSYVAALLGAGYSIDGPVAKEAMTSIIHLHNNRESGISKNTERKSVSLTRSLVFSYLYRND